MQRVFVEGIATRLREDSRVISAGKISLPFPAPPTNVAGNQIVVSPPPDAAFAARYASLGVFDLLPSAGEPTHFTSLNFPDGAQSITFQELSQSAYSGHVRLMLAVELFNSATNTRIPAAGQQNQAAYKSLLARGITISPVLGSYTNTLDPAIGNPNSATMFQGGINNARTALPEVCNYLLSNGSYEIDLAEFSPGGRFVSVGITASMNFNAGIAAYPNQINVYYYAVDEPGVGTTKSYPQAMLRGGATLANNAGGLAAQGYTDSCVLWGSGGNASQVTSVAIYNGTTQNVDVDARMYMGGAMEPLTNITPAVPAQGPALIAPGAFAIYIIEQPAGGGSTINPSSVVAFACPAAAAGGLIGVVVSGE